ncbi:MAG: putative site-specific integrase-resolvase [Candidatus Alkanophagales archaeon MCA70_species_1]|nr:putative site-specific integrase-resolvase [Candidatus Alkanophaga volatiphilum]
MRVKEAAEYLGVHPNTLRKYIDKGVIRGVRIGTHRFVEKAELDRVMGRLSAPEKNTAIIYARVSTRKQMEYLKRQRERLVDFCRSRGLKIVEIIEDIGSGLNERRRGLKKLLKLVREGKAKKVVVECEDRLTRFGLGYLKEIFDDYGVELVVVNQESKSPEEELVRDLIAIVTSFSGRIYGKRGARRIVQTIKEESAHA